METPFVLGWARLTTSGVVGDAGKTMYFSGYSIQSSIVAGKPYFIDGQNNVTGALVFRGAGGVSNSGGNMQDLGVLPVTFVNGIYCSFDSATTAVTVFYLQGST